MVCKPRLGDAEALERGVLAQVVADGPPLDAALRHLAKPPAVRPVRACRADKATLNARFEYGPLRLACGVRKLAEQVAGEQHHEGIKASMAKREPGTTDR